MLLTQCIRNECQLRPGGCFCRDADIGNIHRHGQDFAQYSNKTSAPRGETKLIIDAPDSSEVAEPDPALIKMIANAHQWWEDLVAHRYSTMRALSEAYSKNERYVARVLQLAFLAPEIVDAIVAGTQPIEMTAQQLITLPDLPPSWTGQNFPIFGLVRLIT